MIAPAALASSYVIIIANYDVSGEQETVIFSEHDIAPGFSKDYRIRIDNRADIPARVVLDKIEKVLPSSDNLAEAMELNITYNGTKIAAGKYYEKQFINREIACVPAETMDFLDWNLSLPVAAGNIYQGDSFELHIAFKIDDKECKELESTTDIPGNPDAGDNSSGGKTLPKTGQSQATLNFLYGMVGLSLIATLIFAGLVFLAFLRRRKEERKDSHKKKTQFESIRKNSQDRKVKQ